MVQQGLLSSPCILCLCGRGEQERSSAYVLVWVTVRQHIATLDNSFLGQEAKQDPVSVSSHSEVQCSRTELPEMKIGWDWRAET